MKKLISKQPQLDVVGIKNVSKRDYFIVVLGDGSTGFIIRNGENYKLQFVYGITEGNAYLKDKCLHRLLSNILVNENNEIFVCESHIEFVKKLAEKIEENEEGK